MSDQVQASGNVFTPESPYARKNARIAQRGTQGSSEAETTSWGNVPLGILVVLHITALTLLGFPEVLRLPHVPAVAQQFDPLITQSAADTVLGRIGPSWHMGLAMVLCLVWSCTARRAQRLPGAVVLGAALASSASVVSLVLMPFLESPRASVGALLIAALIMAAFWADTAKLLRGARAEHSSPSNQAGAWMWACVCVFPVAIAVGRQVVDSVLPAQVRRGDDLENLWRFEIAAYHWGTGFVWCALLWSVVALASPPYTARSKSWPAVVLAVCLVAHFALITEIVVF